jgi:hypothetical protein
MQTQNGVQIFDKGEALPKLPDGLTDHYAEDVVSPYGFKISIVDGKPRWVRATEEDYRASEAQRLAISLTEVKGNSCTQIGPRQCDFGPCWGKGICKLLYNPATHYYYCMCA